MLSLQPNMALVRGKHTIKAGLDYRVTRYTQYRPSADRAILSFDQGFTRSDYLTQDALSGNGAASLLLGYAGSGSAGFTANPFFQWIYTAPWVQDDIKLTRKLALNLGLRWDYHVAGHRAVQPPQPRLLRERGQSDFEPDQPDQIPGL